MSVRNVEEIQKHMQPYSNYGNTMTCGTKENQESSGDTPLGSLLRCVEHYRQQVVFFIAPQPSGSLNYVLMAVECRDGGEVLQQRAHAQPALAAPLSNSHHHHMDNNKQKNYN